MEEEYERLQAKNETDDDANDSLETRMQDLEVMMEASTEQLEDKIEASNTRLESKIDDSNRRLEAMFRELIGLKASRTDSTVLQPMEPLLTTTALVLEVTPTTTTTIEKRRATSPTLAASGVSDDHSGDEEGQIGAQKKHGGGPLLEKAAAAVEEEGEAATGTAVVDEVVQEIHEDVNTTASAAQRPEAVEVVKVINLCPLKICMNKFKFLVYIMMVFLCTRLWKCRVWPQGT